MKDKSSSFFLILLTTGLISIAFAGCSKSNEKNPGVTDRDENFYSSVTIGTQTWMVENLKTTKFNDGTEIPLITDAAVWMNLSTPGYQFYNGDPATYKADYGALYNWYAVGTGKLCPTGWHVPTDVEWTILTTYLSGEEVSGGKLKETGFTHWLSPNTKATNESGFTALPGGLITLSGAYANIGYEGNWWTSDGSMDTNTSVFQYIPVNQEVILLTGHNYLISYFNKSHNSVFDAGTGYDSGYVQMPLTIQDIEIERVYYSYEQIIIGGYMLMEEGFTNGLGILRGLVDFKYEPVE